MGLALDPSVDAALQATAKQSWSERLVSSMPLPSIEDVPSNLKALLEAAWQRS